MKIIFFGTSEFAASILKSIAGRCHIIAAVTRPDRKKGRSLKLSAPPVKTAAVKLGIRVLQPPDINDPQFAAEIKGLGTEAFVVASFGSILGRELLSLPKSGSLNIHPSLLPKYRGAAPIHRAVLAGEGRTGVTIIRMDERLDAGDIILQREVKIEDADTSETLSDKLVPIAAELLAEAMRLVETGRAGFIKQDEDKATFAPKLKKEDGLICWHSSVRAILNQIRAMKPWPGTYCIVDGKVLKVAEAAAAEGIDLGKSLPGEVILADQKKGLVVRAKDGAISILKVQMEGKKAMTSGLFLRGCKIRAGIMLE